MRIYFISIGGVGTGNLALLLHQLGHTVSGSEISKDSFYPPMSDLIINAGIHVDFGFDERKITRNLDLVVIGGAAATIYSKSGPNPQIEKARNLNIETISFAEGIGRFVSKNKNIEVIGNHGKTTNTGLIAHSLSELELDPSFFCGGEILGLPLTVRSGQSDYSVCEGDEYPTIPGYMNKAKFMYHKPYHVLLTSAQWDHKNIFLSVKDYLSQIGEIFSIIPSNGIVTACLTGENILKLLSSYCINNKINLYFTDEEFNYTTESNIFNNIIKKFPIDKKLYSLINGIYIASNIVYYNDKTEFDISYYEVNVDMQRNKFQTWLRYSTHTHTKLLGRIGVENYLGSFTTLVGSYNLNHNHVCQTLSSFQGVRRKHEFIKTSHGRCTVINDHAHSPIKIINSIQAVRSRYKEYKLIIIFHVAQTALKEYLTFLTLKHIFNDADVVIIMKVKPENIMLSEKLKKKYNKELQNYPLPLTGKSYQNLIRKGSEVSTCVDYPSNIPEPRLKPYNVNYIPNLNELMKYVTNVLTYKSVILILSSGNVQDLLEKIKEEL